MTSSDNMPDPDGEIVRSFLIAPQDRQFGSLYRFSLRHAIASLRYLSAKGYSLPVGDYEPDSVWADMAIDILGAFFSRQSGRSSCVIFQFFQGRYDQGTKIVPANVLKRDYLALLRGFVRQELWRIKRERDPSAHNLKRRFRDIVSAPPFKTTTVAGNIYLVSIDAGDVDESEPVKMVDQPALLEIARQEFAGSINRKDWCERIARAVKDDNRYSMYIPLPMLLSVAVQLCSEFVEIYGLKPARSALPDSQIILDEIARETKAALIRTRTGTLEIFIAKGKVDRATADYFIEACALYLADLTESRETDKPPVYFRAKLPGEYHDRYYDGYRYVFETMLSNAVSDLRANLRKNSILRSHGYYLTIEGSNQED